MILIALVVTGILPDTGPVRALILEELAFIDLLPVLSVALTVLDAIRDKRAFGRRAGKDLR